MRRRFFFSYPNLSPTAHTTNRSHALGTAATPGATSEWCARLHPTGSVAPGRTFHCFEPHGHRVVCGPLGTCRAGGCNRSCSGATKKGGLRRSREDACRGWAETIGIVVPKEDKAARIWAMECLCRYTGTQTHTHTHAHSFSRRLAFHPVDWELCRCRVMISYYSAPPAIGRNTFHDRSAVSFLFGSRVAIRQLPIEQSCGWINDQTKRPRGIRRRDEIVETCHEPGGTGAQG